MNLFSIWFNFLSSLFRESGEVAGASFGKSWIVLHHWMGEPETVEEARRICVGEGYSDIPYNYIITRSGVVWKGRPDYSCAANLGINSRAIAVCFLGNGEIQDPSREQLESASTLIRNLLKQHPKAKMILHSDVVKIVPRALYKGKLVSTATACPGRHWTKGKFGAILWQMVCGLDFEKARKKVIGG